ncbi:MAG TPA: hypothetical protein VFT71_05630 [Candidatus Nitrosocosmicus sp.]|nr:hypothetical protein [Candidatus Nitrosocosmicus sp.]
MKYEKVCLILLLNLMIFLPITSSELFFEDRFHFQGRFIEGFLSSTLGANDTFSISGAAISTINLNSNLTKEYGRLQTGGIGYDDYSNGSGNMKKSLSNETVKENQVFEESIGLFSSNGSAQQPTTLLASNQTDNLSNNLVSMLSGIIIQSIEKGNPTINNVNLSDPLQLKRENVSIILAGNWQMSVIKSKVTIFDVTFVMITSNGTGFHWHSMNNLKNEMKTHFGTDDDIYLTGTVDFLTDNKVVSKDIKVAIMIDSLETVQFIILDDKISSHLYGYPIYGTVDKIEIPN